VIGAGVSGLTTAVCLAEAGLRVIVRAERPPARTTSAVAGALWVPHLVEQSERMIGWARATLAELLHLATDAATGVRVLSGVMANQDRLAAPAWAAGLADFRACRAGELPAGYPAGWRFTAPLVDMPVYLGYLLGRLRAAGGSVETGVVHSLAHAAAALSGPAAAPALGVVNCTGVGARDLVPDPLVRPVRGQVVVVANPGLSEFFADDGGPPESLLYYLPHATSVVLGGTSQADSWELRPDPATARRILARCAAVEPRLHGAEVIAHRVGLRPVRPRIRAEAQRLPDGTLLCHNYGHGGAGITLSWGCARTVAGLIIDAA
jgi:D-amino-acid oxidase